VQVRFWFISYLLTLKYFFHFPTNSFLLLLLRIISSLAGDISLVEANQNSTGSVFLRQIYERPVIIQPARRVILDLTTFKQNDLKS